MSRFGQHTKLVATAGNRDALVAKFMEAVALQRDNPDCNLMFVSVSPVEPSAVYVTEVWTSAAAWEQARSSAAIDDWSKGLESLVAEEPESTLLVPVGGKGLRF